MKKQLANLIQFHNEEIKDCNEHLEDLPQDIKDIKELETLIGNNKDLSRAYDLGRKETLEQIKERLNKLKDC